MDDPINAKKGKGDIHGSNIVLRSSTFGTFLDGGF
jgi:hypothetical protein